MATPDFKVYLNGLYFLHLDNSDTYGDRPEPYRQHERNLWLLYNLIKNGHIITITDMSGMALHRLSSESELLSCFQTYYNNFIPQLDKPFYTNRPHPNDILKDINPLNKS